MAAIEELYWLAGILEGEGHFRQHVTRASGAGSPKIDIKMTDADVIYRVAEIMTDIARAECKVVEVIGNGKYKSAYQIQVYGDRARLIMRAIVHLMGYRRRQQIWQTLNGYNPNNPFVLRRSITPS